MLHKSSVMLASTLFSAATNAAGAFRKSPVVDPLVIRAGFAAMRRKSGAGARDIADHLGVSEGELIAAHVDLPSRSPQRRLKAQRLRAAWPALIEALASCGEVMALTGNASCVHEKTGVYANASHQGSGGLVRGDKIGLCMDYQHWTHGFAVDEAADGGLQRSLQFFDAQGGAVHQIFQRPATERSAWDAVVDSFKSEFQRPGIQLPPPRLPAAEAPDASIDVAGFRRAWASMRDTDEFTRLVQAHGLTPTQALRLADPRFAQRVDGDAANLALNAAARDGVPLALAVGNPGTVQVHNGTVTRVVTTGPWLTVQDPGFKLHLREDHIAGAWVVGKPTSDGLVNSIELFDARGEAIAVLCGERRPGRPEPQAWRALVAALVQETTPCTA